MTTINIIGVVMLIGSVLGYGALFLWVLTEDKRKARKEGDMLEVLGRIGLGVCLCGYAAIVLWVWGWDKRKDRRERRRGESSDKAGAVQQGNVSGAESGAGERSHAGGACARRWCLRRSRAVICERA